MSANDALAELAGPPRDRWGRYLLPHPEHPDDKPRSFTRATTVAKAPEDPGFLSLQAALDDITAEVRILAAARFGIPRLLDNVAARPPQTPADRTGAHT